MPETLKLDEQVAIITGAAQGIGRGIALVLAGAGVRLVIGDIQDASSTKMKKPAIFALNAAIKFSGAQ